MAIYSLHLGFISRGQGRSSVGFSAYISGTSHKDERTGKSYSYTRKKDVVTSRVLAPEDTPDWVFHPNTLWNRVEQEEDEQASRRFCCDTPDPKRRLKNEASKEVFLASVQTAQTIMGALPHAFSQAQAEACVEEFFKVRFVTRGLIVHYAIHWDNGNPHFHGLITRRPFMKGEFSPRKDREIVSKPELRITRKMWEVVCNKHLALAGREERIDCRSHKDRGLPFIPSVHEGHYAQQLAAEGQYSHIVEYNKDIRQRNIEILLDHPETLIRDISQRRTTFTRKHITDEIIRRIGGDAQLFAILKAKMDGIEDPGIYAEHENFATHVKAVASRLTDTLLSDSNVTHRVGLNPNREDVFTSRDYKTREEKLISLTDSLHQKASKTANDSEITAAIQVCEQERNIIFSHEQQEAVRHLCTGPDIRLLNGRAGTGKTTLLRAVALTYTNAGYTVIGTSFQGKVTETMEREIGIKCWTLDSLMKYWDLHMQKKALVESGKLWGQPYLRAFQKMKELEKHHLCNRDVIIVDEANMIGGRLWERFLEEVERRGAKLLIVQDMAQIKSREPGDYGRLFAERFGTCDIRNVVRQKVAWQRECSALLNDGRIADGLKPYQEKGHIQWLENTQEAEAALLKAYFQDRQDNPNSTRIALAYRNKDVDTLNHQIRHALITQNALGASFAAAGQEFSIGDRVRFTENDHHGWFVQNSHANLWRALKERFKSTQSHGVKNGTFGTVLSGNHNQLKVQLDDGRQVKFSPCDYPNLTLGYALNVNKSEGTTFDRTFVTLDPLLNANTLLVAMTRHRESSQAFVSREEFIDFKALVEKVGYGETRETIQDYQIPDSQRLYFERVRLYRDLVVESSNFREEIEGGLKPEQPLYKHASFKGYQALLAQKKEVAKEIISDWDNHLLFARLVGLRQDLLEVEAGLRPRMLSDLEYRASLQAKGYMRLVRETTQLWNTIKATHPPVLAKLHPLYEDYQKQKLERDALTHTFQENPKLYLPFLRVTQNEDGTFKDYWGNEVDGKEKFLGLSIKQHAKAHEKIETNKAFEAELLDEERESYLTVKAYQEAAGSAASLFHLIKNGGKENANLSEAWVPATLQHLFREKCELRDTLALQIVSESDKHQPFVEKLNIREGKLFEHATLGEVREKATLYVTEKDPSQRAKLAKELEAFLQTSTIAPQKIHPILKQISVEQGRLAFDIAYKEQSKMVDSTKSRNQEYLFNHVRDYLNATIEVGNAWKIQDNHALQQSILSRKEAAQRLLSHEEAFSLFKTLHPNRREKLQAHAGDKHSSHRPVLAADQVLAHMQGRFADLVVDLLGNPNKHMSKSSELRFGSKGKIVVHITGPSVGIWYDFASGEGGNIFHLVMREKGMEFKEAVAYCARFIGLSQESLRGARASLSLTHQSEVPLRKEEASRLEAVFCLYHHSKPIEGTVAEIYLRHIRGITCLLPQDVRFLLKDVIFMYNGEEKILARPCLASFGRDVSGDLRSVQLTRLTHDGRRAFTSDGTSLPKIQYGISKGAFVTLQQDSQNNRVFIAEGVETALSIKMAGVEGKIVAASGIHNIRNYEGAQKEIILCTDNDGVHAQTQAVIQQTAETFRNAEKTVTIIQPHCEGQDFNDVLRNEGIQAVQKDLKPYLFVAEANSFLQERPERRVSQSRDREF